MMETDIRETSVSPDGKVLTEAQSNDRRDEWQPTDENRAFVASLMGQVAEPGKFADWIAPPAPGINGQAVDSSTCASADRRTPDSQVTGNSNIPTTSISVIPGQR